MKAFGKLPLFALLLFAAFGCASTTVTGVWTDENYKQTPIQTMMVIGVAKNPRNRNIFESAMVAELEKYGVKAIPSTKVLGDQEINKETVAAAAEKSGVQTVLVTRLVAIKNEQVYHPPHLTESLILITAVGIPIIRTCMITLTRRVTRRHIRMFF